MIYKNGARFEVLLHIFKGQFQKWSKKWLWSHYIFNIK